jgi:dimethylglycine dehydrogenase
VALALLPERLGTPGTRLDVAILGEWKTAEVIADSPYDPSSARARM